MLFRRLMLGASAAALVLTPIGSQDAYSQPPRVKYAKTEVEKATGKCVAAVLGGALLGGLLGGKKGAVIGAGAGSLMCVILQVNARNKDKIIAGQIAAAAAAENGQYSEVMQDEQNRPLVFVAQAGPSQLVDGSKLMSVQYSTPGSGSVSSPSLDTGGHECRQVNSAMSYGENQTSLLPAQIVCRTSDGDWQPYAVNGG